MKCTLDPSLVPNNKVFNFTAKIVQKTLRVVITKGWHFSIYKYNNIIIIYIYYYNIILYDVYLRCTYMYRIVIIRVYLHLYITCIATC